jgi:hypothetical protein
MSNINLKPVNIENLERIFNGIWSGELPHNQTSYFCETSCCVAGWDVALNAVPGKVFSLEECAEYYQDACDDMGNEEPLSSYLCNVFSSPWDWSRKHNSLTHAEAILLFSTESTKPLHEAVLKAIKEGRRLDRGRFLLMSQDRIEDYNSYKEYYESCCRFEVQLRVKDDLYQFLKSNHIQFFESPA